MRVTFYQSEKHREREIALAFQAGVQARGDECQIEMTHDYRGPKEETDVAVVIGVKGVSQRCAQEHRDAGKQYVYIDKGYFKSGPQSASNLPTYYKVAANAFQGVDYMMRQPYPQDRWEHIVQTHDLPRRLPRDDGSHVLIMGSSDKYTRFHGLGDATIYWAGIVQEIQKHTSCEIIYRPKHSWQYAKPLPGTIYSRPPRTLKEDLRNARVAVTHGSNSCVEAILSGIPVITLGPAIAAPICSSDLADISALKYPGDETRHQWLCAVAYSQYTTEEMAVGLAWKELKRWLQ